VLAITVPVDQAALLVDALLMAAYVERLRDPALSCAYEALADEIGDALDACPAAPGWTGPEALSAPLPAGRPNLRAVPG
jgi:hypothetical protein